MVKVKDVFKLFDVGVDVYYKGSFVCTGADLLNFKNENHWVLDCEVSDITVGDCEIALECWR